MHTERLGIPLRFKKISKLKFFIITNKALRNKNDKFDINADAVFVYKK